jgi:hypothetical protein
VSDLPVICFGQQPNGFFPKRFFVAKVKTARRLQAEMGGSIVYFCHDSDHDPRETRTTLHHLRIAEKIELNFTFDNKIQRKYSPLYLKRVRADWREKTLFQLPAYAPKECVEAFRENRAGDVAGFCLEMYRRMGLLDGVTVMRSSSADFRRAACEVADYFVDVRYEGEIVRARHAGDSLVLQEGGDKVIRLPAVPFTRAEVSPTRDSRLVWMQSVIRCTHYVAGAGEQDYLHKEETPEIAFIKLDEIDNSDEAWTGDANG